MYGQGLRHLYLEQDPKVTSLDDILGLPSTDENGNLVREAVHLGMQVHFFDDRSRQREQVGCAKAILFAHQLPSQLI